MGAPAAAAAVRATFTPRQSRRRRRYRSRWPALCPADVVDCGVSARIRWAVVGSSSWPDDEWGMDVLVDTMIKREN